MDLHTLRSYCQDVLARYSSLAVIAIPWLYFTNSRDATQAALCAGHSQRGLWQMPFRIVWLIIYAVYSACRLGRIRYTVRKIRSALQQQHFSVVMKTWSFFPRKGDAQDDFYFGDLQRRLQERGDTTVLLCGNVANRQWRRFLAEYATVSPSQIPDIALLRVRHIIDMVVRQVHAVWILASAAWRIRDPLMQRILRQAAMDCLKSQTFENGLHYWLGREIVKIWHPKTVITLFEGYAWERCFFRGVKSVDPHCVLTGYQHTIVMQRALELRHDNAAVAASMPEIILATGPRSIDIMRNAPTTRHRVFVPLGSFRRCASVVTMPRPTVRTVLVTPEGVLTEAVLLCSVTARLAAMLPDHRFILRCHPALPFAAVRPYCDTAFRQQENIEISTKPRIEEDFQRSSVLCYRGSSSVLYAVMYGLKPFYWQNGQSENIDPLAELSIWRESVATIETLCRRVLAHGQATDESWTAEWQTAVRYVHDYALAVSDISIQHFRECLEHRREQACAV